MCFHNQQIKSLANIKYWLARENNDKEQRGVLVPDTSSVTMLWNSEFSLKNIKLTKIISSTTIRIIL